MTDTTALADRIVALLGGKTTTYNPRPPAHVQTVYMIGEKLMGYMPADDFVRDGRVILALMKAGNTFEAVIEAYNMADDGIELEIAIATTCVEALET